MSEEIKTLGRDDLIKARWPEPRPVEVPELGGRYWVRMLSAQERDEFEASCFTTEGGKAKARLENMRGRLVAICACDEQGRRVFSDLDANDLGQCPGSMVDRIFEAAQSFNLIGARAKEEVRGNS